MSCVTVNPSLRGTRWGRSWGPSSCAAAEDFPSASPEPLRCVVNSLPREVSLINWPFQLQPVFLYNPRPRALPPGSLLARL